MTPAATGGGMAAGAAQMQRDREAVGGAGLQDWPVAAPTQRLQPARRDHHLGKTTVAGALLDLLDRRLGVFGGELDRGLQPRLAIEPLGGPALVLGGAHGGR